MLRITLRVVVFVMAFVSLLGYAADVHRLGGIPVTPEVVPESPLLVLEVCPEDNCATVLTEQFQEAARTRQGRPAPDQGPKPVAVGPHVQAGKLAKWVVDNTVKLNGWSFTGYSKTGLDADYRPWRLHVGLIGGELDAHLATDLQDRRIPDFELLETWNRERHDRMVLGICITKRF